MSLRQAYRDLIYLSLFLGLILTFVWTLYDYLVYRETFHVILAFVSGLASTLVRVARFVFG